jgi:hypothetical protein
MCSCGNPVCRRLRGNCQVAAQLGLDMTELHAARLKLRLKWRVESHGVNLMECPEAGGSVSPPLLISEG